MVDWNPFDLNVDQKDDDDTLVMNLSSLHMTAVMDGVDPSWIYTRNTHKHLVNIIKKYNDSQWLSRSQHIYCIFYAVDLLGILASLSAKICEAVVTVPGAIEGLLRLWKGGLTWFEQRATARTISSMCLANPNVIARFMDNSLSINIVELAMTQYSEQAMAKVIKRAMTVVDRYPDGDQYRVFHDSYVRTLESDDSTEDCWKYTLF